MVNDYVITFKSSTISTRYIEEWWEVPVEWRKLKTAVRLEKNTLQSNACFWQLKQTAWQTVKPHFRIFFFFWNGSVALCHQAIFWFTKMYSMAFLISCLFNFPYYHCCSQLQQLKTSVLKGKKKFKIQNMPYIKKKKINHTHHSHWLKHPL